MSSTQETHGLADDIYGLVGYLHTSSTRDLLDAIAREQLSFSQLMLLERLRDGARPTVHEAAAMIGISRAGASRVVDSLARRGLVRREEDPDDFRARRLTITDRGRESIVRLHRCRLEAIAQFASSLEPDQAEQLQAAIRHSLREEHLEPHRPPTMPA